MAGFYLPVESTLAAFCSRADILRPARLPSHSDLASANELGERVQAGLRPPAPFASKAVRGAPLHLLAPARAHRALTALEV